jgi:tetratricopeptide (TPR) repeat protein
MSIEQTLQQAIIHHKAGKLQEAEPLYRSILIEEPKHSDANHNLGVLLKQGNQLELALGFFKTALEANPNQGQYWVSYIEALINQEQLDLARNVLRQGRSKGLKGDIVEQLAIHINQLSRHKASLLKTRTDSIIALYSQGRMQEALTSIESLTKESPNESLLHNISGACYAGLGQLDAAVKSYEQALVINPDYAEAYNNLGVTLKNLGQQEAAVKCFERAFAIKLDYAEPYNNLGNSFQDLDQYIASVNCYEQAIKIKPDYAEAYCNLANAYKNLGQLGVAVKNYEKALEIKPDYVEVFNNFGLTLFDLGQLEAAVKCYEKALEIKADYPELYNNLGNTLKELGRVNTSVKCYEKAIIINPDYVDAHNNLGNTLKDLGQLDAAIKSYEQALAIKPRHVETWRNLYYSVMPQIFSETSKSVWLNSFKNRLSQECLNGTDFRVLDYRLKSVKPHMVENSFKRALKALPAIDDEAIANPELLGQWGDSSTIPEQVVALMHFGRSGTGLFHSLIDNHPEISTLPSIYFSEFYSVTIWKRLIAKGWTHLPERFVEQFAVLFDARSSMPVPSIDKPIANLGQKEGMVSVGEGRNEALTVDKAVFCSELRSLMSGCAKLSPKTFFDLVHVAYEKALNNSEKDTIFYHIHNPSPYAKLNFLRYNPEAKLLMMVREPIQSCESWLKKIFNSKDKYKAHNHIITMLFDIDQIAFRRQDSMGVRLEDLKEYPQETMAALCDWMGVKEAPSLYEMTAQGKKWWGDPSSPDYGKEAMTPFGDSAIKRLVGSIFSEQDQFILGVLFYPFRVRFGYVEANLDQFKKDLQTIKPLLDKPFDFEKKLSELSEMSIETFLKSGSSLYFRAGLHARWEVLEEFHDYPDMLTPLEVKIISE